MISLDQVKSSKRETPKRIIVLGKPKAGKSTFASKCDSPVFIPIVGEEGIDDIDVPAFPVAESFSDVLEMLGALCSDDKHQYKNVVVDSVSALELLVWDHTCSMNSCPGGNIEDVGGGYGKGYQKALGYWRELVQGLDYLRSEKNMGCILIGHVKVEKFNDPTLDAYDRYHFDIHKKAAEYLTRWADGIVFMSHKVKVKKEDSGFGQTTGKAVDIGGGEPKAYTQERPSHPGGGRGKWSDLPYEMEPDWVTINNVLYRQKDEKEK